MEPEFNDLEPGENVRLTYVSDGGREVTVDGEIAVKHRAEKITVRPRLDGRALTVRGGVVSEGPLGDVIGVAARVESR